MRCWPSGHAFQDTDRDAITRPGAHCDPADTVGTHLRPESLALQCRSQVAAVRFRLAQTYTKVLSVPLSNCLQGAAMA